MNNQKEVNLLELIQEAAKRRATLSKIALTFLIFGFLLSFTAEVKYESKYRVIIEQPNELDGVLSGGLSSLAGMAGINLDALNQQSLNPEIYPEIVYSAPFLLEAINTPVFFNELDTTISTYSYYKNLHSPSILFRAKKAIVHTLRFLKQIVSSSEIIPIHKLNNKVYAISEEDTELLELFKENIDIKVDSELGVLTITTRLPEPTASAELATVIKDLLTARLTEYSISKAVENLNFLSDRYDEAKTQFEIAQADLAAVTDRNKNLSSSTAQIELERRKYDYNLAFEVFRGLSQQLEQAKILVKNVTPLFSDLEPVTLPLEKSSPKRLLFAATMAVVSCFCYLLVIFLKPTIKAIVQSKHN